MGTDVLRRDRRRRRGRATCVRSNHRLRRGPDENAHAGPGAGTDPRCSVRVTRHRLDREFFRRDPRVVAPELLNKILVHGERSARLVEVEAYCGSIDPGSHAYKGMTNRNATMFGPPGG